MTDLMLDHRRVSRRHAYFQVVAGRLFCLDLGSRTGIEWDNGSKESGWLDAGRKVSIGTFTIWQQMPASNEFQVRSDDQQRAETEGVSSSYGIDFVNSAGRQPPLRLGHSLALVGSSPECRVRLPYNDVSKAHCALLRSPAGIWVVDLLGDGGTYVNNTHVKFSRLDDGDELRVGKHVLKFRFDMFSKPSFSPVGEESLPSTEDTSSSQIRALSVAKPRLHVPRTVPEPEMPSDLIPTELRTLPAVPSMSAGTMATTWSYPSVEVQSALGTQLAGINQAELVQALMQPMMQQFGLMQQQMYEQFHQAMMSMFQSFGAAHREQMDELRDEIDEVRRLTQELHDLQTEAALAQGRATPAPSPGPSSSPSPTRSPAPSPTSNTTAIASRYGSQAPVPPIPDPTARSRPKPSLTLPGTVAASKVDSDEIPFRKSPIKPTNADVHSTLTDRIASLQSERQSRWQKILAKLNKAT
jgi:pSer/pThr/pTyr-binding forkhead associated (FHA) protein